MTYAYGLFCDKRKVKVRLIRHLGMDIRDRHLLARWDRLTRRWIRHRG
jgi:hypothetical protein